MVPPVALVTLKCIWLDMASWARFQYMNLLHWNGVSVHAFRHARPPIIDRNYLLSNVILIAENIMMSLKCSDINTRLVELYLTCTVAWDDLMFVPLAWLGESYLICQCYLLLRWRRWCRWFVQYSWWTKHRVSIKYMLAGWMSINLM